MPIHLCDPGQLGAELGQNRVLLGLHVCMKLRLDLPRGCVHHNSRKLNCTAGSKGGTDVIGGNDRNGPHVTSQQGTLTYFLAVVVSVSPAS